MTDGHNGEGNAMTQHHTPRALHSRRHTIWLALVTALLAALAFCAPATQALANPIDNVLDRADSLMANAEDLIECATSGDSQGLTEATQAVRDDVSAMQDELSGGLWSVAGIVPVIGSDVRGARELVDIASDLVDNALVPLSETLAEYPLTSIVQSTSFDVEAIQHICDTVVQIQPAIKQASDNINALGTFNVSQLDNAVSEIRGPLTKASNWLEKYLPLVEQLPAMLGADGSRSYLVVAQNNVEIRSTGGFPGAMCLLTIDNGTISLGEIGPVGTLANMYDDPLPITDEELAIFGEHVSTVISGMSYNPDFTRVAGQWSEAWLAQKGQQLDGVIALDPILLQYVMDALDISVTMSNGAVLDGSNAATVLMHDSYMSMPYSETNAYFVEAADKIYTALQSIDATAIGSKLGDLYHVIDDGIEDGHLLAWMANEDEQEALAATGCSGAISHDPTHPVAGVYVSDSTWSKIDWYLDLDVTCGEATENADGSKSYQMTVRLGNLLTYDEIYGPAQALLGVNPDLIDPTQMLTTLFLYAPAGGTISDVQVEGNPIDIWQGSLDGIQVWTGVSSLLAGESSTITYTVTTSPEATSELELRVTPTVAEIRDVDESVAEPADEDEASESEDGSASSSSRDSADEDLAA